MMADTLNGQLSISVSPEATSFYFLSETSSVDFGAITQPSHREDPAHFSQYVLNTDKPFIVTIRYLNTITGVSYTKNIETQCYKNKKTILTGRIFDAPPNVPLDPLSSNFKMSVNEAWDPNDEIVNF